MSTPTIIPSKTRVTQAIAQARLAGAELWIDRHGRCVIDTQGRPGWTRLTNRQHFTREAPCAA